jgi:hypothetical protein
MNADQGNGFIEVQGIKCYFPPPCKKYEIINYGLGVSKQKWKRTELPIFMAKDVDIWSGDEYKADEVISWEEASRQEQIKIYGTDPHDLDKQGNQKEVKGVEPDMNYSMECLENFREQELNRFYNGVWIQIKGSLYYLPGSYYFYLNYWELKDCYPEFRYTDLELFWFWESVKRSHNFLGWVYITMRGVGKSSILACIYYYETVTHRKASTTVQSKSDDSAAEFFREKVLLPMSTLPNFLVPIHKHSGGEITSLKAIQFVASARKGLNKKQYLLLQSQALRSKMSYTNAGVYAADGGTYDLIVQDEIGKTSPSTADVFKRIMVNRFTVWRGNKKLGNIIASSTVEDMKEGGEECLKIWENSNQYELNENNTTNTGLVRFFRSALDTTYFDEFGFPDRDKAKTFHDNNRKSYQNDQQGLVSYIQKNPYNEKEAFWINAEECIYNAQILLAAKDRCMGGSSHKYGKYVRQGDIIWQEKDVKAIWVDNDKNGKWLVSDLDFEQNMVQINDYGGHKTFTPKASHKRVMALDPYSASDIVDVKRGSNAACVVYNKPDFHKSDDYCDTIIADYLYRHDDLFDSFEDIICACFFFGCEILIEDNKTNAKDYFRHRGYMWGYPGNPSDFVMARPESTLTKYSAKVSDGITAGSTTNTHAQNSTSIHIVKHGHKLKHVRVIDDWLKFRPDRTQEFDMAMAASWAVVAAEKKITEKGKEVDISGIFKRYDNSGSQSKIIGR